MLKITTLVPSDREITLQLDGRVTGQWVHLLRESSELVLREQLVLTLDLENIRFIDCDGIALIKRLINRGVQQINAPLFVAEQIKKCEDGNL